MLSMSIHRCMITVEFPSGFKDRIEDENEALHRLDIIFDSIAPGEWEPMGTQLERKSILCGDDTEIRFIRKR